MPKLSDNQLAAVDALKRAATATGADYIGKSQWKKEAQQTGAKIGVDALLKAGAIEKITVAVGSKPTEVYRLAVEAT